jgi:4-diphosphocytidyl-2-C-methyl-D-erythritol kinase
MVPVRIFDSLAFEPVAAGGSCGGEIEFSLRSSAEHEDLPADGRNLVVRALELLRTRSGCEQGARVELVKRIPSGAGLGGGSSDAAAALRLANRGWALGWPTERLATLASELGSDVPFFLEHGAAICRGRGEQVERLPRLPAMDLVIVKPPVSLSTAAVYQRFDELPAKADAGRGESQMASLVDEWQRGRASGVRQWMGNSLQRAAACLSNWVGRLAEAFGELDFVAHQLSGSGSAYFGVCRHAGEARRLAAVLKSRGLGMVFVTRSCM